MVKITDFLFQYHSFVGPVINGYNPDATNEHYDALWWECRKVCVNMGNYCLFLFITKHVFVYHNYVARSQAQKVPALTLPLMSIMLKLSPPSYLR